MFHKRLISILFISSLSACSDSMDESTSMTIPEQMMEPEIVEQLRDCPSTHANVGHTGELSTLSHSVSGTVTIVNDCTIEITNFNFDGGGIIVEVYAGQDEDYFPPVGFAISDNLVGSVYNNETLTVQLPSNKTLDDLNSLSIWCSDVGVSFGDTIIN